MVKVFIPSAHRAETCTTPQLLDAEGIEYTLVLHDDDERQAYLKAGRVDPARIMVSGQPFEISVQRQWIMDELVEMGEWFISLDDNIRQLTAMPEPYYFEQDANRDHSLLRAINLPASARRFMRICDEMIIECTRRGAMLFGFATTDNGFFRRSKFRDVGYVLGKAIGVRKTHIEYDPHVLAMDDYAFTAAHLYAFGRVLINDYVHPVARHYQQGGIGAYEARLPKKLHDTAYLMGMYPELFNYKQKVDHHPKAELEIRFVSIEQVETWRRELAKERAAEEC